MSFMFPSSSSILVFKDMIQIESKSVKANPLLYKESSRKNLPWNNGAKQSYVMGNNENTIIFFPSGLLQFLACWRREFVAWVVGSL